jgi:3-methylcrotonyl-CoA carboxylase beta subunit
LSRHSRQHLVFSQANRRNFAWHTGKDHFDAQFEQRLDRGNFPHDHINYTRVLDEEVDSTSEEYLSNYDAMQNLNIELEERMSQAMLISMKEQAKLTERNKNTPRQRISKIIDRGSPFLEIGGLAGYDIDVPSGNVIAGIGVINGHKCMLVSNNFCYKGGAYYPITVKKHLRAQEIAEQDNVFPDRDHFGRIFYNQARMSAKGIPQIAVVMGSCTAGGAYVPAMSDEVVMVKRRGTVFLGGPPLVQAATGERVTEEELGGANLHCEESGVSDHLAKNEQHAFQIARSIVANLGVKNYLQENKHNRIRPEDPLFSQDELNGIIPVDHKKKLDMHLVLGRIMDGSRFHEFKERYGTTLITGFGHMYGYPVGIVANNGVLFSESAQKGAHFVQMCSQRKIPIVFLQNITGFMVGKKVESEGIAKHGAKLVSAVANANVPKITAILGASYGAGNYGMNGRAYSPRFLYMLPSAKISVMGGTQASEVLSLVKFKGQESEEATSYKNKIIKEYDAHSSAYYSTSRLWDDGIVKASDLRRVLGLSLVTTLNAEIPDTRSGVFRM